MPSVYRLLRSASSVASVMGLTGWVRTIAVML